jgi:alpha-N-arabinofuranosidase
MKKLSLVFYSFSLILLAFSFAFCKPQQTYQDVEIQNPVLAGFYPDPSVCKGADGYYLVNSTFGYFPGVPIFYSPDLVQWQQIGHVMDRPEQLDLEGLGVGTAGIYAPTIELLEGVYYVTCTFFYGKGNYIVTATNPAGPW